MNWLVVTKNLELSSHSKVGDGNMRKHSRSETVRDLVAYMWYLPRTTTLKDPISRSFSIITVVLWAQLGKRMSCDCAIKKLEFSKNSQRSMTLKP